jgi:hypothetical protein
MRFPTGATIENTETKSCCLDQRRTTARYQAHVDRSLRTDLQSEKSSAMGTEIEIALGQEKFHILEYT